MATILYKTMTADDVLLKEPGFVRAFWTPIDDFSTISEPILSDPQVIGEKYSISTDHEWQVGKEAIELYINPDTLTAPGESNGEVGTLSIVRRPKAYIMGDGPIVQEIVQNMMNARGILLVQKNCDVDAEYIQYGCDCDPSRIEKVTENQGEKVAGGSVGYEIIFRVFCKYFYFGAVSIRT